MAIEHYIAGYNFPVNSNCLLNGGFESNSFWAGSMDQSSYWYDSSNYYYGSRGISFFQSSVQQVNSATATFYVPDCKWNDGWANGGSFAGLVGLESGLSLEYWTGSTFNNLRGFVRVESVNIPQGSTINSATLVVKTTTTMHPSNFFQFRFKNVDNATLPTSPNWSDICSATLTDASTNFTFPGTFYSINSLDCRAHVQEIVNRPGWTLNNAMMAIIIPLSRYITLGSVDYSFTTSDETYRPKFIINWTWTS